MTERIVWIDLEMTGLKPEKDTILETACIITDKYLNIIAEQGAQFIHHDQSLFKTMDPWCQKQHTKSGLWQEVVKSKTSLKEAEENLLSFIKQHVKRNSYMAGNSIWQDRRFIINYMPNLDEYLHYRMIDVTSVKILKDFWHPAIRLSKKESPRALDDIKESITKLKYYMETVFDIGHEKLFSK